MYTSKINRHYNSASGIGGAKKIYMIGIKGVGMTMLAQYLSGNGIEIIGSDTEEKFMTDEVLEKAGIKVIEKFDKNNIPRDADLIIYSRAYNADNNIEVKTVLAGKIRTMTYAQAMGKVFNQKYGIAVVGSHGKTTTTAWLGYVMEKAGLEPSVMVGAAVPQFSGASLVGKSDYLVIEADEYQNKLKYFQPKAVLLNNIDYDHPDFFPTKDEYENVFIEFIKKIPAKGFLVANFDDPVIRKIVNVNCKCKIISHAIDKASAFATPFAKATDVKKATVDKSDYVACDIKQKDSKQFFKVKLEDFYIQLQGKHNISNALAVIATCVELGIKLTDIKKYLAEFKGTARRMQVMGKFKGATIIDDYAHHPTEIKATLAGARELYKRHKIIAVFHPHTFSRTKALLDDFAESFELADEVIVLDIYGSARERHGGVHSKDLVDLIRRQTILLSGNRRQTISYISTLNKCEAYLRKNIERGDVVILMGAGDVFKIGENLVE